MKLSLILDGLRSFARKVLTYCKLIPGAARKLNPLRIRHHKAKQILTKRNAFRRALLIEGLEGRRPLAFSIASSGTSISLTGSPGDDAVVISVSPGGYFLHDLPLSGNLVSNLDTDGSQPGEQAIAEIGRAHV